MLYKFKSQVAAEVVMLQPSAEELLKIIGKEAGPQGIITVGQVPAAIAALRTEIERREAMGDGRAVSASQEPVPAGKDVSVRDPVTLRQRAVPFMDLLERSAAAGKDVVWGV